MADRKPNGGTDGRTQEQRDESAYNYAATVMDEIAEFIRKYGKCPCGCNMNLANPSDAYWRAKAESKKDRLEAKDLHRNW